MLVRPVVSEEWKHTHTITYTEIDKERDRIAPYSIDKKFVFKRQLNFSFLD